MSIRNSSNTATVKEALSILGEKQSDGSTGNYLEIDSPSRAREIAQEVNGDDSTKTLLEYSDGRCGAWKAFSSEVFRAQGIFVLQASFSAVNDKRFQVKKDAPVQGGGGADARESIWNDHGMIAYNGYIYDPSYGLEYGAKGLRINNIPFWD